MNIRPVIAILISLIAIVIASYYTFLNKPLDKYKAKASVIELIPFPTIISNEDGHKDNSLYDLLINKSDESIFIKNANIQLDNIKFLPFDMKGLSIIFAYDKDNNRVNFSGSEVDNSTIKIEGHYEITNKNNVSYDINISNSNDSLNIKALYNPTDSTAQTSYGPMSGQFTFKSSNIFESLDKLNISHLTNKTKSQKYPVVLEGDFSFVEGNLLIDKLNIDSEFMYINLNIEPTENSKFKIKANIKNLNIDNIFAMIGSNNIINYLLYNAINNLTSYDIEAKVKAEKIIYNTLDITAADFNFISKDKEMTIKNLTFILPDHTSFNTSGVIIKNKFRTMYKGNISLKNATYDSITTMLNLPKVDGVNSKISLSTGITLSKSSLILDDLEIKENDSTLSTNLLKLLSYDSDSYLLDSNIKINRFNDKSYFIKSLIDKYSMFHNLLDAGGTNLINALKTNKHIINMNLDFNNVSYHKKNISNVSFKYSVSPNVIMLENISSNDEAFKVLGRIDINLKNDKPHFDLEFASNSVDIELFNKIIGRRFYDSHEEVGKNGNKVHKINIFRFDLFDGKISLNLKDNKSEMISSVNCKANIKDGIISMQSCGANALGGEFNLEKMSVKLDEGLSYDVEYLSQDLNVNKVIKFLKNFIHTKDAIKFDGSGKVSIKGHEKSHGNSFEEIINNADGKIIVKSAGDITINNLNLYSVISTYGNPGILKAQSNKSKTPPTSTTFKNVSGAFTIDKGNVKTDDFNFITNDNIRGQSSFRYSILDEKIKGLLSLVYLSNSRKIDGFNLSFSGDVGDVAVKLGTN